MWEYNVLYKVIFNFSNRPNHRLFITRKLIAGDIKIGNVITYQCISFSSIGIPKNPVVLRKREDLLWDDVLKSEIYKHK